MIACAHQSETSFAEWNKQFLQMLPQIRRTLRYGLRDSPPDRRPDDEVECIASAFCTFIRLVEQGKANLAYPTVLAKFAVRRLRSGRRVGTSYNGNDIGSWHVQRRRGITVVPFSHRKPGGQWEDLVVEDRRSTPAEVATCRLDFRAWLGRLDRTKRAIASFLAGGGGTGEAARRFQLTAARISQLRRELQRAWEQFQAGTPNLAVA